MKSSQVAAFADNIKIFKTIVTQEEFLVLRADLRNLASWSSSVGLAFNNSKGEVQRIIRKLKPVTASYQLNEHALGSYTAEKEYQHFPWSILYLLVVFRYYCILF